ncbi:Gag-Pol polyprotein [Mycena venus]|uniref:Gag-Pol polyprotein n=1 Tax=Mycena venus TaxID=2733690 RepID=A0A8H6Z4Q8_9AGAR|nr:Gag-Pol polyprotein [Mycena venus]
MRTGKSALSSNGDFAIVGKGTVNKMFRVAGRRTVNITFKNALHAPSLSANLISVSQLDKAGYWSKFGGGEVGVYEGKDGMMLLRGRGSDGMYILDVDNTHAKISTTKPVNLAKWHGRMVHSDVDTIREMHAKGLVDNLDITNMTVEGKCISCRAGRQHARPYDGHTDPMHLRWNWWPSIFGVPCVGSSHKYVAFLKDKSDDSTIAALDEYHVMAERQTGHKVKRVKTDNAFNSGRWKEYFKTHGIIHEQTSPYSSAQNGLTERAIHTIMEDIRALLHDSGLPHKYWAAAGACSVYTRNLMPSRRHPGKIPEEVFSGQRQSVAHLRVFGSRCSAKVNTTHSGHRVDGKSKIESRSIPATLIGYASGAGNYILIDKHGVQFESRNVEFDEGVPHRTVDVGERLWMQDDAPLDMVPSNSTQSDAPDTPGVNSELPSSSSSAVDKDTSTPISHSNSPDPEPAPTPPPRRSGRTTTTTTKAVESREYAEREHAARSMREDWATGPAKAKPRAHAAFDPVSRLNNELDDYISQTLMSYHP